jgi:hypothetical protein
MTDTIKNPLRDAKSYQSPGHFNMTALRLHGKEETGTQRFWMGLSHSLPRGGVEYDESPLEKTYFVHEGEVTMKVQRERLFLDPLFHLYWR